MIKTITALSMLFTLPAVAEIPKDLAKIQREGHYYYRIDRKAQFDVYNGRTADVAKPFHVLPKNSPASCSHEVAIKIKMLRDAGYKPLVAVYNMKVGGRYYPHTVVVLQNGNVGFWVFNNQDRFVDEYTRLDRFTNLRLMTYEQAVEAYND